MLLLHKLPLVAGEPQQRYILLEEHQLLEVSVGQNGPLRPEDVTGCGEHPLHGSRAREGSVVLLPMLLGEEGPGEGFPSGLPVHDAGPQHLVHILSDHFLVSTKQLFVISISYLVKF